MNQIKEAFSKIKLKDYEKKWLVNILGYILFLGIIRLVGGTSSPTVGTILVLVFIVWTSINILGLVYAGWTSLENLFKKKDRVLVLKRFINWLNTSDRA